MYFKLRVCRFNALDTVNFYLYTYAAFHWDRELVFTVITRLILFQTRSKLVNTSRELVILATTSIFVTNEINWRETTETK